jgi:hypothetical protein
MNEWRSDFRRLCKLTIALSVEDRLRYGFIYDYKPILDDAEWRSFESMEEYRLWCQEYLPEYLGYGTSDLDDYSLESMVADNDHREIRRRKSLPGYQDL